MKIDCDVQGFGYLLARGEEIPVLGTLWIQVFFAKRAPNGKILFRTMLGGAVRPELLKLNDSEIQQLVQDSLAKIMKISAKPELVRIYRHGAGYSAISRGTYPASSTNHGKCSPV